MRVSVRQALVQWVGPVALLLVAFANVSAAPPTWCIRAPLSAATLAELKPLVRAAAERHPLPSASYQVEVAWMMAILSVETGQPAQLDLPAFRTLIYPTWQVAKTLSACAGLDTTVGVAQVRPETALQLLDGRVENGGRVIVHNVLPLYNVRGDGPRGVNVARLAQPEVSIEYLAANLEMAAVVGAAFGRSPTLDDLARWHNTGLGGWNRQGADPALWSRGSVYIERVRRAFVAAP